jgi:hypothetical protein
MSAVTFKKFGLVKEYSDERLLLLDFDDGGRAPTLDRLYSVTRTCGLKVEWVRQDRTVHGWHMVVRLRQPLQPWQTLALQAILGSDWRREAMNWARLAANPSHPAALRRWNILYEEKVR